MSTFQELKDAVLVHQFASAQYDTFAGTKINEGLQYIAAQVDLRGLHDADAYATVAGTASYALPADFLRVDSLTQTDSDELQQLLRIQVSEYDLLDTTTQGRPTFYTIDRSNIKLYPTPDAVYNLQLRFYRKPATLVAGQEPDGLPAPYHHLLEDYAKSKCFARENDVELEQQYWGRFQEDLKKARGELQRDANDLNQVETLSGMWTTDKNTWPDPRIP